MGKVRVLVDVWRFLWQQKKYWLIPIVVVLVLMGLLVFIGSSSPLAPFIYTLY